MPITQAMATSFKVEILTAYHNFGTTVTRAGTGADTFKIALYTSAATLGATTTVYSTTNEVASTGNYTAGGNTLTISQVPTSTSTTAWLDFADTTWSNATITANGALIYNSTQGNRAVAVLAFGGDKTSTAGDFTIIFPTADSSNAIIRIA
jgi:hypothetical protein